MPPADAVARETARGYGYAVFAFCFWGVNTLYFKLLTGIPALHIMAHRALWILVIMGAFMAPLGRLQPVLSALRNPAIRWRLCLSGLLIGSNWLFFIWAVGHDRVLEVSLGYFMTPLTSVLTGVVILRERLTRLQWISVGLAAFAVLLLIIRQGNLPWVTLGLAGTWSIYALVRKVTLVDPFTGLFIESTILAPIALVYLIVIGLHGEAVLADGSLSTTLLLINTATITIIPLLAFNAATKRLPLSTIGIINYISPTLQLLMAVWLFGEPFTTAHALTFGLIWLSLALFSWAVHTKRAA